MNTPYLLTQSGVLNFHKPVGVTSNQCIGLIKRLARGKIKIGHGGTLDPFASGVLPLGINRGTKALEGLLKGNKTYTGLFSVQYETDTLDLEGQLIKTNPTALLKPDLLETYLKRFPGTYLQTTPIFSARKVRGRRLYHMARAGKEIHPEELPKREVTIHDFVIEPDQVPGQYHFKTQCSKGTYIRQLVKDLAQFQGLPACLEILTRTESSGLKLQDAIDPFEFVKFVHADSRNPGKWWNPI